MNTQKLVKVFDNTKKTVTKYSPEILLVTGIVSGAAGLALCIKKSIGIKDKLEDNYIELIEVDRDDKKELIKAYGRAAGTVVKEYAPVVLLEGVSLACILGSNKILNERSLSLFAAATIVERDFNRYRENVKKRYGEEVDQELYFGLKTETVSETVVDPDTGKKRKIKKEVKSPTSLSPYAVYFDASTSDYANEESSTYNASIINGIEIGINEEARANGKIFLGDIYKRMGIKDSTLTKEQRYAARTMGYVWDYDNCDDMQIKFYVCDRYDAVSLFVDFSCISEILDDYASGAGTFYNYEAFL